MITLHERVQSIWLKKLLYSRHRMIVMYRGQYAEENILNERRIRLEKIERLIKLYDDTMDIKEEIFNFISTHEAQVSHDMNKKDENIKVSFTTFGNRAGCKAVYDIIQMLDDGMKLKAVEMMRNKRVL